MTDPFFTDAQRALRRKAIDCGLALLAEQWGHSDRRAFRETFHEDGDAILDALVSHGYATERGHGGPVEMQPLGYRREADNDQAPPTGGAVP